MGKNTCTHCSKKTPKMKKPCKIKEKNKVLGVYVCEDCNRKSISADAVCRPRELSPEFVCKKCGSPAVSKKSVCKPKAV